jgi:hypothetical protein
MSNLTYTESGGEATITGTTNVAPFALVIPATIDTFDVVAIAASAFESNTDVTSIVINDTVTSSGSSAFKGCTNATSITLSTGMTAIPAQFLRDCTGILSISVPSQVTNLEDSCFRNCSGVTGTFTIPNTVTTLGPRVLQDCTGITGVSLPSGATSIPNHFMYSCTSVTSLTIPSGVTAIGTNSFRSMTSLSGTVTLPTGLATIGTAAFQASGMTTVTFPAGNPFTQTLAIATDAFRSCSQLETLYLYGASGIGYSIGNNAFLDCNALTSILFEYPNDVTTVGTNAFPTTGYSDELFVTYYHATQYSDLHPTQQGLQTTYFDNATTFSYVYDPSCFAKGTHIRCFAKDKDDQASEENVPVEDLRVGDLVKTYQKGYQPVVRIEKGFLTNNPTRPDHDLRCMYTMPKEGTMTHDLTLVGGHSLMVDSLTAEESAAQRSEYGFEQRIDDKALLLVAFAPNFAKVPDFQHFCYYLFAVGEANERHGIYANGSVLCELPSAASLDKLHTFK